MARLFVAVRPPGDVLAQLAALPRAAAPGVRWVPVEQLHVTVRFLGEAEVDAATAALDGLDEPVAEAVLGPRVGRLGREVLMVPVRGLEAFAAAVARRTAHVGVPPDPRPFLGHLTLARLRGRPACGLTDLTVSARWLVTSVELVASRLGPEGARHDTLASFPLGPPHPPSPPLPPPAPPFPRS